MITIETAKEYLETDKLVTELKECYELIEHRYNSHSYKLQINIDSKHEFDISFDDAKRILFDLININDKRLSELNSLAMEEAKTEAING